QKPDIEPRATGHITEMLEMIRRLEARGIAYRGETGDVNFSVRKFPGYGKLSGKSPEDLRAGERVEVDTTKRDPLDFVLWKRAKDRKSTRLNSSHLGISYAVFCLKKKKQK